ncbi:hypothetical protein [Leptospira meyeri]|uniref:hypothetical protein n=1 Tax=Leptospira meyeri TaxID=29508 RepID=UPI0002BEF1D7|nr:hypothetical protein [Leptospira meyeri]EMJ89218.1 hypothetical protein LEP1GSC196_2138 [Leptospira meyeri serovar Semaranga str. Veldrot Semarang 173]PKA25492.1 hypothetical protein CH381_15195 [Leptospira sp. mixed culture ATI2-C-A1]
MQFKMSIGLLLLMFSFFQNCYFNPVVNGILNPLEKKEDSSFLSLLGIGAETSNLLITGQIRDQNGSGLTGLVFVPSPPSFQSKAALPTYTTDSSGRFYLPFQTGSTSYEVLQNGTPFFTLILIVVSPTEIGVGTNGAPSGLEISDLTSISASEPPNFFDLVRVFYLEGGVTEINIHNANLGKTPNPLVLEFSEPPASVDPEDVSWMPNSMMIIPAPSVGYLSPSVSGNQLIFSGAEGLMPDTEYFIAFTSNIKSATGKLLSPRFVRFCYSPSVACVFY